MRKNLLVKNQVKFFTYNIHSKKITSLIIHGLPTYSTHEIAKDLKAQSIPSVLSVKPFVTTKAKREGHRIRPRLVRSFDLFIRFEKIMDQ